MKLRGKEYKLSSILLILFVVFMWTTDVKPDERMLDTYKKELIEKESWLLTEIKDISTFMDLENSEYIYSNREVWFKADYYGYEYHKDKLVSLHNYLINRRGWVDMTTKMDVNDFIVRTQFPPDSFGDVRILCNNKATILIHMDDKQNDEVYKDTEVRTLVELLYDYSLPCYDLNAQ